MRWVRLFCLSLLLLAGCGEDAKHSLTPTPPGYWANSGPDSVVANVALAWTAMDAAGYTSLLDAGFDFYFFRDDPTFTYLWGHEEEIDCAERLLSGQPGAEIGDIAMPGIASIAMTLSPEGDWEAVTPEDLEGHSVPDGTLRRSYALEMLVRLREPIEGTAINGLHVAAIALLYCRPLDAGDPQEWRLWRWEDFTGMTPSPEPAEERPGPVRFSLSGLKLYFEPDD